MSRPTLALVFLLLAQAACVVRAIELLEGKACPCARGLVCDIAANRCVLEGTSADLAGVDLAGVDLAGVDGLDGPDAGDLGMDAAAPGELILNGDFELPTPLYGTTRVQSPHAGMFGARLCATTSVLGSPSAFNGLAYQRTLVIPTRRYRFTAWVHPEPSAFPAVVSISLEAYSMPQGGPAVFAGRAPPVYSTTTGGWQQLSVLLDPSDPGTSVSTSQMIIEWRILIEDLDDMGCVLLDDLSLVVDP